MNKFSLNHQNENIPRRTSSPRGRVIVVTDDDDNLLAEISGATNRPVKAVTDFYEAMGELATTDMLTAPAAVIARSAAFAGRVGEFTNALRKIDPAVTVLAVGMITDDDNQLLASFVDEILQPPVSRLVFERAIQTAGVVRTAPQPTDSILPAEPTVTPAQTHNMSTDQQGEPATVDNENNPTRTNINANNDNEDSKTQTDPLIPVPSPRPNRHESITYSQNGIIGDGDLIDRILHDPGSITALLELAVMSRCNDDTAITITITDDQNQLLSDNSTPIIYQGNCLGSLSADWSTETCAHWAQWLAPWLALARQTETWRRQAYTDDLTGAGNRRYFDAIFRETLTRALRKRECVTLLIFDIDDFKHFNDSFGHAAGDEILIETIRLLKSVIRPKDVVCRVGGDEFAVIFYDASGERQPGSKHPDDITRLAERFQQKIAQHQFPKLGPEAPGPLTISGGLATFPWDGRDAEILYQKADQALLAAKRAGKNAIILGPNA